MTTAHFPASGRARRSALEADDLPLPAPEADRLLHDHGQPEPLRRDDDRMSVCFEVRPPYTGDGVPEQDARRVGMARKLTAARLRYCGLEALVDDATLIVSELVTNALQHGDGGQITMTMTVQAGVLRLAVHGETPGRPVARSAPDDAECGRGLFLVDCLAAAHGGTWGTDHNGATTWCTLAVDGRA
ncbi:Histidine kinase-like ATPase domain-containing protein [Streptomyces sp. di188]|nr:Histidine kinase-like ATPase domain-containing protein [Streptomyces sp. di50b]SCE49474.1 Histidine kinase-like ATPase domain-containing protein [Streptomyces sp. di188]